LLIIAAQLHHAGGQHFGNTVSLLKISVTSQSRFELAIT
jgi:hypothetical protein